MGLYSRRSFVGVGIGALGALAGGCRRRGSSNPIPGRIVGASASVGHRLRTQHFSSVEGAPEEADVVIVGGGVAGLGAARRLRRKGIDRIVVLELEDHLGGSANSGRNAVSAYPWGAHYVPLPNPETTEVIQLFKEFGVLTAISESGLPTYDETMLCADPNERLFLSGRWQEGLVPQLGISEEDRRQYDSFFGLMEQWRGRIGSDGRLLFAIPADLSSSDPEFRALDAITMEEWLNRQGYTSKPLRWYVDYSCRDDYGAGIATISAWVGVHYFASRRGEAANAARDSVVTWPEGNGWLVNRMAEELTGKLRPGSMSFRIENTAAGVEIDYVDLATDQSRRILAKAVVCALPRFVAQHVVRGADRCEGLEYSPWMVAAVTLDSLPTGRGAALAWDNVMQGSESLGYVVATHQNLESVPQRTVISHYWPLDGDSPQLEREKALARTHAEWCDLIVRDLTRPHPDIRDHITQIDVWVWGHGMIRPVPGFITGTVRQRMLKPFGRVFFAHSDMSGLSLFEEAYTRGVQAADSVLQALG